VGNHHKVLARQSAIETKIRRVYFPQWVKGVGLATWGRLDGRLSCWRKGADLGIEIEPLYELLIEIRNIRDSINRHTRVNDKYTVVQSLRSG
jgi:hypothetical protein